MHLNLNVIKEKNFHVRTFKTHLIPAFETDKMIKLSIVVLELVDEVLSFCFNLLLLG